MSKLPGAVRDEANRAVSGLKSPETLDAAREAIYRAWEKDIKPFMGKLDEQAKETFRAVEERFQIFRDNPAECTKKFFDEMTESLEGARGIATEQLRGFLKSAGSLLESVATKSKEFGENAWKAFNIATSGLRESIKQELGMNTRSEEAQRSR